MIQIRDDYKKILGGKRLSRLSIHKMLQVSLPGSRKKTRAAWVSLLGLLVLCTNCTSSRNATYFNDLVDSEIKSNIPVPESIIQKNDVLGISITSLNAEATSIFNTVSSSNVNPAGLPYGGYLVTTDGNIELPVLGSIKVEGLTKARLK